MHQLFVFTFWNRAAYQREEVTIVGLHYDDARTGAWAVLSDRTGLRNPRVQWRLVSTVQAPLFAEVAS